LQTHYLVTANTQGYSFYNYLGKPLPQTLPTASKVMTIWLEPLS
jgi:hypothetical protein